MADLECQCCQCQQLDVRRRAFPKGDCPGTAAVAPKSKAKAKAKGKAARASDQQAPAPKPLSCDRCWTKYIGGGFCARGLTWLHMCTKTVGDAAMESKLAAIDETLDAGNCSHLRALKALSSKDRVRLTESYNFAFTPRDQIGKVAGVHLTESALDELGPGRWQHRQTRFAPI